MKILEGDCRELLRGMPASSVRCCVTSPPYWGLRDYGTAKWEGGDDGCEHNVLLWQGPKQTQGAQSGHSSKANRLNRTECECGAIRIDSQLGLERTPGEYVERMVEVFREVRRVLADDGTLWLNLGDSYSGGGGYAPDAPCNQARASGDAEAWGKFHPAKMDRMASRNGTGKVTGLKPKDLVGIPWRVAFALQADGWWLRSDIIWAKPNPMPESVTDRPTKAHEYLFLLSKRERYYYDAAAIAEPGTPQSTSALSFQRETKETDVPGQGYRQHRMKRSGNKVRIPGCDRIEGASHVGRGFPWEGNTRNRRSVWTIATQPFPGAHFAVMPEALVEPCILAGSAPGDLVLDPFAGAGTVGVVALRHGRRFVGCELNPEYVGMARKRIAGPLFAGLEAPRPVV